MTIIGRFSLTLLLLGCTLLALADEKEFEPVDLPKDFAALVKDLSPEKVEFLRGKGPLGFAERNEILFEPLQGRSPEQIEAYIDAMMRVNELLLFNPDTDMASIPLNTESKDFNSWKTKRPVEFDTHYDAGHILRECLNGMALRSRGITEEHYLSPLTTDHGQDKS